MKFTAYILYSERLAKHYAGQTQNLAARLQRHNYSGSPHTARGAPWVIVYQQGFLTRAEAMTHEKRIKKIGVGKFLRQIIAEASTGKLADASP